jgi:hypothetical protein
LTIHRQHLFVRAENAGVVGQGNGTGGFDAGDQVIDEGRLLGTDVDLVKGDGDGWRALGNINTFPAEILGRRGEDKIRRFRVVDRSIGKNEGRGDAGQGFALAMGGQGLEKTFVIGLDRRWCNRHAGARRWAGENLQPAGRCRASRYVGFSGRAGFWPAGS